MFLNELHVRFVQLYLVMSISSSIVLDILLFLDFGRKVKKVEEGDSAPPKKSPKLSKLAERGKRLATARKRSQRRRDKLKEQIDVLGHTQGKAFTEAENKQAVLSISFSVKNTPRPARSGLSKGQVRSLDAVLV